MEAFIHLTNIWELATRRRHKIHKLCVYGVHTEIPFSSTPLTRKPLDSLRLCLWGAGALPSLWLFSDSLLWLLEANRSTPLPGITCNILIPMIPYIYWVLRVCQALCLPQLLPLPTAQRDARCSSHFNAEKHSYTERSGIGPGRPAPAPAPSLKPLPRCHVHPQSMYTAHPGWPGKFSREKSI